MNKQVNIKIKKSYFEKKYKTMKTIYNTATVLDCFCESCADIEEMANIKPIIKYLRDESDKLCFNFSNIKYNFEKQRSCQNNAKSLHQK